MSVAKPVSGLCLVALAAALWATVGVANSFMQSSDDPALIGFLRTLLGAAVLWLIASALRLPRGQISGGVVLMGIMGAVFQTSLFAAFASVGVTVTVVVTVCGPPIIVAIGEALLHKRAPGGWLVAAFVLAILGVLLVLSNGNSGGFALGRIEQTGAFQLAAASGSFAALAVLMRITGRKMHPIRAAGNGLAITATILFAVVAARPEAHLPALGMADISIVVYIGIAATGGAYLAFINGMKLCQSAGTGLAATMIEPLFALFFAALLLQEPLTSIKLAGCALLLFAMPCLYAADRRIIHP